MRREIAKPYPSSDACSEAMPISTLNPALMGIASLHLSYGLPRNDGLMLPPIKTACSKTSIPSSPYRHGKSAALVMPIRTPATISGLLEPRMQRDRRRIERQFAVLDGDAERLAQFAGARAQRALVVQAAAAAHRGNAVGRLQARGSARRWPSLPFRRRNSRTNGCHRSDRHRKSPADRTSPCCAASAH